MKKNNRSRIAILAAVLLAAAFCISGCSAKNNGFFEQNKSLACWDSVSTNSEKLSETAEHTITSIPNSNYSNSFSDLSSVSEYVPESIVESVKDAESLNHLETKTLLHITGTTDQVSSSAQVYILDILIKELSHIVSNNLFASEYESSNLFPGPLYQYCAAAVCNEDLATFDNAAYDIYFYYQGEKTLIFPHDSTPSPCEQEMLVWQHATNNSILYVAYRFNTLGEKDGEWKIRRFDALGQWYESECRLLAMELSEPLTSPYDILFGIAGNPTGNIISITTTDSEWSSFVCSILYLYRQALGQEHSTVELPTTIALCLANLKNNVQTISFDTAPDSTFLSFNVDSASTIVLWRDGIDPDDVYLGFSTNSEWTVSSLPEYGEWLEKQILLYNHQQYRESKLSGDIYHPSDWQVEVARRQAKWTREERLALAMEEISHDQCQKLYVTSYNPRIAIEHLPKDLLIQAEDSSEQIREYYVTRSGQLLFTTRERLDYGQHGYYFQAFSQPASFCIYYEGNIPEDGLLDNVHIRSLLPEHEEHRASDIDELQEGWRRILGNDQTQVFGHDEAMDKILRTAGWEYFEKCTAENGAVYYSNGKIDIWSYLDNYFDGDRFTYYFSAFPAGSLEARDEVSLAIFTDGELQIGDKVDSQIGLRNLYFD